VLCYLGWRRQSLITFGLMSRVRKFAFSAYSEANSEPSEPKRSRVPLNPKFASALWAIVRIFGFGTLEAAQLCLDLRALQLVDLGAQHRHGQEH
jgi:hypothetical protein